MTRKVTRERVRNFLNLHARPLDAELLAVIDGEKSGEALLQALVKYQNADGGFGHGIEPDLQSPMSHPLPTSIALRYMRDVAQQPPMVVELVARTLDYLKTTLRTDVPGWFTLASSISDYPAAPWWNYERAVSSTEWGNPSAELTGYFLRASRPADLALIDRLWERAIARLNEIKTPEFHELICFQHLYYEASASGRAELWPTLSELIVKAVDIDKDKGAKYGATPLTFIEGPNSAFLTLFGTSEIEQELQQLVDGAVNGDHWEPNWTWQGAHPDAWPAAHKDWTGMKTLENLRLLVGFDVI